MLLPHYYAQNNAGIMCKTLLVIGQKQNFLGGNWNGFAASNRNYFPGHHLALSPLVRKVKMKVSQA